ncbi:MAG: nitroreductase family protein, partial [Desulfobacteraceae bacterium]|nr:nitroreductase family protein [Desulfobacteraceae bacterium]
MSLFEVSPEKCNRDGICVAECPVKIIELKDGASTPVPVPGADAICINCGHCVAVCPTGALSHKNMTPGQCPPVRKDWLLTPDQAEHFLRCRRSIRTYKKELVEKEILARLIEIASYAPSGHNTQPVHWRVVHDSKKLHQLTGMVVDWMRAMIKEQPAMAAKMHMDLVVGAWDFGVDVVCRDAPHIILAHGLAADTTVQYACTIAVAYLELAAPSLGLGTCWGGFFGAAAMF